MIDLTPRWYRLAACCPKCRRRPKQRLSRAMLELANLKEPDEILESYECHGYNCDATYLLAAIAYQRAEPDPHAKAA